MKDDLSDEDKEKIILLFNDKTVVQQLVSGDSEFFFLSLTFL